MQRALRQLNREAVRSPRVRAMRHVLEALLVVETYERPALIRLLERCLQLAGRRRTTCGPLQLRNSPWRFAESVQVTAGRLEAVIEGNVTTNWEDIAACWHGPASNRMPTRLRYAEALQLAHRAVVSTSTR